MSATRNEFEVFWEIQQKCPEENNWFEKHPVWLTIATFFTWESARAAYEQAIRLPESWESRLVDIRPKIRAVSTVLAEHYQIGDTSYPVGERGL